MTEPSGPPRRLRGSRWSDDQARAELHAVVEAYAEVAGFDVVGVSAIRDDGYMHVLTLIGPDDARDVLLDSLAPAAMLLDALPHAEDWGALKYLAHDRHSLDIGQWGWLSGEGGDVEPGRWHPEDLLVAPLHDDRGTLVAVLGLDVPRDGRVPAGAARAALEAYTRPTSRAITAILERERLAEQIRLAEAAAAIVRRATASMSADEVLVECGAAIVEGFRAQALWTQLLGDEPRAVHDSGPVEPPPALVELLARYAAAAWEGQSVGVFAPDREPPPPLTDADVAQVLDFLGSTGSGAESLLVVPLGAGAEHLGWLALTRARGGAEWSSGETTVALDIGRDLGQTLVTARTLEREHRLVQELQEVADYKSRLVATVSHELRTPLTSVVGFAELLAAAPELTDRSRAAVEAIQRGSVRLSRVVEDLLVLHRATDGGAVATGPVDLSGLVTEVVELHEGPAAERRISLDAQLPPDPVVVIGVGHELEHLVANLVGNAVKYTGDGGAVTVTLEVVDDQVVLTCTDTGIGIAPADQAHVFEEFYRSDDPEAVRRAGSGLGLAIVRRVVERHGGRVDLDSELGRGSTFRACLPLRSAADEDGSGLDDA